MNRTIKRYVPTDYYNAAISSTIKIDARKRTPSWQENLVRMSTRRLSGIQRDVLALYRKVLRETLKKDRETLATDKVSLPALLANNRSDNSSTSFASDEFRRQAAAIKRSDFKRIEYMIRKGEKQIKLLRMPGVKVVGGTA